MPDKRLLNFRQGADQELVLSFAALVHRTFLKTLDQRNLSIGAAEMLKMACIKDQQLFEVLYSHAEELISGNFQVSMPGALRVLQCSLHFPTHIHSHLADTGSTWAICSCGRFWLHMIKHIPPYVTSWSSSDGQVLVMCPNGGWNGEDWSI